MLLLYFEERIPTLLCPSLWWILTCDTPRPRLESRGLDAFFGDRTPKQGNGFRV